MPVSFPAKFNVFLRARANSTTTLISVNKDGNGGGNGDSIPVGISTNNQFVLFESAASDLVANDTNNAPDIFLRDLGTGSNILVSVSTNGGVGDAGSRGATMTPDGRFVAFVSLATNLVNDDTNQLADVFIRDLQAETTVLGSVGAMGGANTNSSESPEISADGRYVAFYSTATNLFPSVGRRGEIYVRDLVSNVTALASTNAQAAVQAAFQTNNSVAYNHALSADGKFVAYEASRAIGAGLFYPGLILRYNVDTGATDLVHTNAYVPQSTQPCEDIRTLDITPDGRFIAFVANTNDMIGTNTCILVWDAQTGVTTLASGNLTNGVPIGTTCDWPSIDATGRFVLFGSTAANLPTNNVTGYHIYLRDLQNSTTTLVDVNTNAIASSPALLAVPKLSGDAQSVAFVASDSAIVPGDNNHCDDVLVRDLLSGDVELVSARNATLPSLVPNGSSTFSVWPMSFDSRYVAFASSADNLTDNDTNKCPDIFVRDLLNGTNDIVSIGTNGSASAMCREASISMDGRYVAFASTATNLVALDKTVLSDIYVCDRETRTLSLGSVTANGISPGNNDSSSPLIGANGKFLLFRSKSSNLTTNVFPANKENLFLRDLQNSNTIALTTNGVIDATMTRDGRYVAFLCTNVSTFLYLWDTQLGQRVFTNAISYPAATAISSDGNRLAYATGGQLTIFDRDAKTNVLVASVSSFSSSRCTLRFSFDGRCLAFATGSGSNNVYLANIDAKTVTLVSHAYNSINAANGSSESPDISCDGRFVVYRSAATNLVAGQTNGWPDVFIYDRLTGTNSLLSASLLGSSGGSYRSLPPVFSEDGKTLVFTSWAEDLAAGDFNQQGDIFSFAFFYLSVSRGNGNSDIPTISWPAVAGQSYRVEFKNDLNDPTWQELAGTINVTGNKASIQDTSPDPSRRIYRVLAF